MATQKPTVLVFGHVVKVGLYDADVAAIVVQQDDEPWELDDDNQFIIPVTPKLATTLFKPGTKVTVTVTTR